MAPVSPGYTSMARWWARADDDAAVHLTVRLLPADRAPVSNTGGDRRAGLGPTWWNLLRATARAEIMPRFRKLDARAIRTKSSLTDLVTEADEKAELMITAGLQTALPPAAAWSARRLARADPRLDAHAWRGRAWLSSWTPIDGTSNYVARLAAVRGHGRRRARRRGGRSRDPRPSLRRHRRRHQGGGSRYALPPARTPVTLHVSQTVRAAAQMTGCVSWRYMKEPLRSNVMRNMVGLAGRRPTTAAPRTNTACWPAGHCDYLIFNRLMPWGPPAGLVAAPGSRRVFRPFRRFRPTSPATPPAAWYARPTRPASMH